MKPYSYKYRPWYGSKKMIIEFWGGTDSESFQADLIKTLSEANFTIAEQTDLWIFDEDRFTVKTELGAFKLTFDTWGSVFLEGDNNQDGLEKLHQMLLKSDLFDSIPVDFSDYKLKGDRPK